MDHDALGDGITRDDVIDIINIIKDKVPDSVLDKTMKIATWNIRNFGGSRDNLHIHYIAEVLSRFDLIAITELKEDTRDLQKAMKLLGPYWKVIYSDSNMDDKGNHERIGYLYDGRVIEFTGLAAEADPIRENFATREQLIESINSGRDNIINRDEKDELIEILQGINPSEDFPGYIRVKEFRDKIDENYHSSRPDYAKDLVKRIGEFRETQNWWRSPYLVSFKAGKFDFVMLAAHIRWGSNLRIHKERRIKALDKLADWVKARRELEHVKDKDMFVLGDFNIPEVNDDFWNAITKHDLITHANIASDDHGSGFVEGKRYDQIFYDTKNEHMIENGGVLNLYPENDDNIYKNMTRHDFEYQISDHFPLWIQLNIE